MASESRLSASRLRSGAVGVIPIGFQALTNVAPASGVVAGIVFASSFSRGSTPLAVLLAFVASLCVAISIGQLAKHIPSAGGLYAYNARGLGSTMGFVVGWCYQLTYVLAAMASVAFVAFIVSGTLHTLTGASTNLWLPIGVVALGVAATLNYRGVRFSTYAGVILGSIEIAVFAALAITMIVSAGSHNTLSVFGLNGAGNSKGIGGVFPAMIFIMLSFTGFESATPLAEEARLPKRTIPLGVLTACIISGAFYLLCYYGVTVLYGPDKIGTSGFANLNNGDPWNAMAKQVWGGFAIIAIFALWNSVFGAMNSSVTAGSRVGFALGRIGILPRALSRVHPRFRTPSIAVVAIVAAALVVGVGLSLIMNGRTNAYGMLGTILTLFILLIYISTCVSCVVFYLRERRTEFNPILHLIVPALGILLFIPVLVASLGIDFAGIGISPLTFPFSLAPWIVLAWVLIGVVYLLILRSSNPEKIRDTGAVFIDNPEGDPEAVSPEAAS